VVDEPHQLSLKEKEEENEKLKEIDKIFHTIYNYGDDHDAQNKNGSQNSTI
jgi:hypothetical protein